MAYAAGCVKGTGLDRAMQWRKSWLQALLESGMRDALKHVFEDTLIL